MQDTIDFLTLQIKALQQENERLNNLVIEFKNLALKARISDPKFSRPISELETEFEIVKP